MIIKNFVCCGQSGDLTHTLYVLKNLYKLHHNHELYLSCLENQYNIVNKYFNKEWLKNYILSKINIE